MESLGEPRARRDFAILEMFLVGQVPDWRVEQVLDILAGLTASQPQRRIEQHVIYRPDRPPPEKEVIKGGSQTIAQPKSQTPTNTSKDLSLARLIRDVDEDDFGKAARAHTSWRQVYWELPAASQKEALLRNVIESSVDTDKPEQYMTLLKYKPVIDLLFEGHQYVQGNIVLYLHRIKRFPETTADEEHVALPPLESFTAVDPANTALLQATIELPKTASTELINAALSELKALQEQLKGVVDLIVPERLAFDTRIK